MVYIGVFVKITSANANRARTVKWVITTLIGTMSSSVPFVWASQARSKVNYKSYLIEVSTFTGVKYR